MKKRIIALLVALAAIIGVAGIGQTAAHAASPAYCNGTWFVHGPYPVGANMASWATCVPNGTSYSSPPDYVWASPINGVNAGLRIGIDQIEIMRSGAGSVGVNYMNGGTLVPYQDTTYAAESGCYSGQTYWTRVHYLYNGTWNWLNTYGIVRC